MTSTAAEDQVVDIHFAWGELSTLQILLHRKPVARYAGSKFASYMHIGGGYIDGRDFTFNRIQLQWIHDTIVNMQLTSHSDSGYARSEIELHMHTKNRIITKLIQRITTLSELAPTIVMRISLDDQAYIEHLYSSFADKAGVTRKQIRVFFGLGAINVTLDQCRDFLKLCEAKDQSSALETGIEYFVRIAADRLGELAANPIFARRVPGALLINGADALLLAQTRILRDDLDLVLIAMADTYELKGSVLPMWLTFSSEEVERFSSVLKYTREQDALRTKLRTLM